MILLIDIGNTHTHLGLSNDHRVLRCADFPTPSWEDDRAVSAVRKFLGTAKPEGISACSVVPQAMRTARRHLRRELRLPLMELSAREVHGIGFDYPHPETIGADRLANIVAASQLHGAPCVVIGFGTATTFSVLNRRGNFCGGVIAPGRALLTSYLHEKTALLPEIGIRPQKRGVGKSTKESILISATTGFRGMIEAILQGIKEELGLLRLPVIATGSYAPDMKKQIKEITVCEPNLTLEGLRLNWLAHSRHSH